MPHPATSYPLARALLLTVSLAVMAVWAPGAGRAQGGATADAPPNPASSATAPGIVAAQAQSALDVLRDDRRRAEFIAVLEGLARAAPARPPPAAPAGAEPPPAAAPAMPSATPSPAAPAPALPAPAAPEPADAPTLAPNSLGEQLVVQVSAALSRAADQVASSVDAANDLPLLRRWLTAQAADPAARARILDAAWKLAVVLGAALAAEWLAARAMRRSRDALARWIPDSPPAHAGTPGFEKGALGEGGPGSRGLGESGLAAAEAGETERPTAQGVRLSLAWRTLRRLPFVAAGLALDLVPVAVFALIGYLLPATSLGAPAETRPVILAVVTAYVLCRVVLCAAYALVAPGAPGRRLLLVSEWTARFAMCWTRRVAVVAVFGYTLAEVGLLFGMYQTAYNALLKLFALVVHVCVALAVLQARGRVKTRLKAPPGAEGALAALRNRVAATWHLVAIFLIAALWLVWAAELRNGYSRLLTFAMVTGAVLAVARLVAILSLGGLDRTLGAGAERPARGAGLEGRIGVYLPVLRVLLAALLAGATVLALLAAWGFSPLSWFVDGQLGGRVVSALLLIGLTAAAAVLVWEAANAGIEQHLAKLARDMQLSRAARLRTLLPMLRASLLVVIVLVVALTVLSELGVNVAPLLAGAGVVGIAVGFGSQKLVQDLITGLFLLMENAMQVGDVVTLGGLSGTVEALSIRTIRLRALDGAVHIVPFSAVTTVTNQTRDYAYAVLDVSVGLDEAPERIGGLLREIAKRMRAEPAWRTVLSDELDVMGVERFGDAAWVMRARIKTLPASRWAVTRELNERIKTCFDELAIDSPFTSRRALSEHAPEAAPAPAPAAPLVPVEAGSPAR